MVALRIVRHFIDHQVQHSKIQGLHVKRDTEGRSCNGLCRGIAIGTIYFDFVFVVLASTWSCLEITTQEEFRV